MISSAPVPGTIASSTSIVLPPPSTPSQTLDDTIVLPSTLIDPSAALHLTTHPMGSDDLSTITIVSPSVGIHTGAGRLAMPVIGCMG